MFLPEGSPFLEILALGTLLPLATLLLLREWKLAATAVISVVAYSVLFFLTLTYGKSLGVLLTVFLLAPVVLIAVFVTCAMIGLKRWWGRI